MSFDLVLFGGTGDLTWRKLMPALFQAFRHGKLPPDGRILAVARDERSDDEYRAFIRERFSEVEERQAAQRRGVRALRRAAALPAHGPVAARALRRPQALAESSRRRPTRRADTVVLFLATSPHLFPVICEQLGAAGLNGPHVRVVLEKPLGHDLASAQEINRVVRAVVPRGAGAAHRPLPGQAGGAEPDGAALRQCAVRAAVAAREHRQHPDHARREHRRGHARRLLRPHRRAARHDPEPRAAAADDDRDGAARRPATPTPSATRSSRCCSSLKPFTPESVARDVVRGQYKAGNVDGKPRAGLPRRGQGARRTAAARPSSRCAPRCRTGAGPACRSTCAPASGWPRATRRSSSTSAPVPHPIFPGASRAEQAGHQAAARRRAGAAPAGGQGQRRRASCCRRCRSTSTSTRPSPSERVGAYERLLLDAIAGRLNLFVRSDEQEQAWRWVEPILDAWAERHRRPARLRGRQLGPGGGQRAGRARRLRLGRRAACMLDRIRASIPALPPAEQRVAKLVLADARSFASLPVARAGRALARQQADRGALLPQHRLRRAGRLQAQAGRQRQRGRALRAPRGRRRRQGRRHRRQGHRQRGGRDAEATATRRRPMRSSAPSPHWPRPGAAGGASSSTASATRASWRRTRSTSSSAWASTRRRSATAMCR